MKTVDHVISTFLKIHPSTDIIQIEGGLLKYLLNLINFNLPFRYEKLHLFTNNDQNRRGADLLQVHIALYPFTCEEIPSRNVFLPFLDSQQLAEKVGRVTARFYFNSGFLI